MNSINSIESKEKSFLKKAFSEYYSKNLVPPPEITKREFGFGFEKKIEVRHKAFSSFQEFNQFVLNQVPFFISYSCALYEFPEARPMEAKKFIGSELVFDFDKVFSHENHNKIICNECLEKTKQDVIRLVEEFLLKDFGFSKTDFSINFSGSKGFHVHLDNQKVRELNQEARIQILNYITAEGLEKEKILFEEKQGNSIFLRGANKNSGGWGRKFFEKIHSLVSKASFEELRKEGFSEKEALTIIENRESFSLAIENGNYGVLKGFGKKLRQMLEETISLKRIEVDRQVSTDLARLIRLPNSIHGETGFSAKSISLKEIDSFNPSKDAICLNPKAMVNIRTKELIQVEMLEQEFTLVSGVHEVPEPVAALLICKGKAILE